MDALDHNDLNNFIRLLQPLCEGVLGEIQKEALEKNVPIIPNETVRFLSVILSLKKPKNILEIGTAVGFSASLMSKYLQPGGKITTIDRFDIMIDDATKNIDRMNISEKVKIVKGDASDVLPTLNGTYDVIFIDAAKGQYGSFLHECIRLMPVGGILIADDVLRDGDIAMSRYSLPRRQRTIHKKMRNFLWDITHTDILETSILPLGHGIALCLKVKDGIIETGDNEEYD